MKTAVLKTIESIIETPFVEDEFELGSVCFANDDEVRADFKLRFTTYHVVNYVYGIYQLHLEENEKLLIPTKLYTLFRGKLNSYFCEDF